MMTVSKQATRPLWTCVRCSWQSNGRSVSLFPTRAITSTSVRHTEAEVQTAATAPELDPNLVVTRREEKRLIKNGIYPIGSRRRRAALRSSPQIPFELLPYQCFQEARKILQADREEKLRQIEQQREKIAQLQGKAPADIGGEHMRAARLFSHRKHLEKLKILADINDPMVKMRFEDGKGDMNRPIYRYLADKKWRSYKRLIAMQRITQMNVVPDVIPKIDPTADVNIAFGRRSIAPGAFVESAVSEKPATLQIQVFDKGERLVTVVVMDSDVPNLEKDGFDYRCHYIASNIPVSPTNTLVTLGKLSGDLQVVLPWLPPFAQKGSPYHRISIFVLEQDKNRLLDISKLEEHTIRDGFNLRSFIDKHSMKPVGVSMFRAQWDEGTMEVMKKHGIPGWDIEFKRKRIEPLPYKKKNPERYR